MDSSLSTPQCSATSLSVNLSRVPHSEWPEILHVSPLPMCCSILDRISEYDTVSLMVMSQGTKNATASPLLTCVHLCGILWTTLCHPTLGGPNTCFQNPNYLQSKRKRWWVCLQPLYLPSFRKWLHLDNHNDGHLHFINAQWVWPFTEAICPPINDLRRHDIPTNA